MGDMAKTSGRRLRRGVALSVAGLVAAPALVLGSGTAAHAASCTKSVG
ncbi:murein L,D-transpeptidase, partial [Streptomyces sp. SID4931]